MIAAAIIATLILTNVYTLDQLNKTIQRFIKHEETFHGDSHDK